MLRIGYSRMRISVLMSMAVTIAFVSLLFPHFETARLVLATGLIVGVNLCRLGLWFWHRRADPPDRETPVWARRFFIGATTAAATWSFSVLLLLERAGGVETAFLVVWVIAVTAVASNSLASHLPSVVSFILTALAPIGSILIVRGENLESIVGLAVWGATIALSLTAYTAHTTTRKIFVGDIERSEALAEAAAARSVAEASNRAKSEFLTTMSHEIRTPMNGILGMTELLRHTALSAQQQRYADAVQQSGEHLLSIINDILDFSKIEAGKLDIDQVDFNLRQLVEDIGYLFTQAAEAKGLDLVCSVPEKVSFDVNGDPVRVRQILTNLVSNAVKFTSRGDVTIRAMLLDETQERVRFRFEVQDCGIGISEEAQARLFGAFVQADSSTTRRFGGSGLGLAIAKRLVEMMDGQIGLHSEAGRGTLFWFELPLKKQNTDANPAGKTSQQALSSALLPPSPALPVVDDVVPSKLGGRVLVAEDNPVNQAVAGAMLESLGVDFSLAANGQMALDRVLHEAFDLVLMDCQMPEMDGFATTMEIRTRERNGLLRARLPIVALTANAVAGDHERCLAAGMDDYLSKPFRREQLAATLQRWLPPAEPINPRALDAIRDLPGPNGASLVQKVIAAYLADTPPRFLQLRAAADAGDADALRRTAHTLKSSSANVGAEQLAALCAELERLGRQGTVDGAASLLASADKELPRVLAALGKQRGHKAEDALATGDL